MIEPISINPNYEYMAVQADQFFKYRQKARQLNSQSRYLLNSHLPDFSLFTYMLLFSYCEPNTIETIQSLDPNLKKLVQLTRRSAVITCEEDWNEIYGLPFLQHLTLVGPISEEHAEMFATFLRFNCYPNLLHLDVYNIPNESLVIILEGLNDHFQYLTHLCPDSKNFRYHCNQFHLSISLPYFHTITCKTLSNLFNNGLNSILTYLAIQTPDSSSLLSLFKYLDLYYLKNLKVLCFSGTNLNRKSFELLKRDIWPEYLFDYQSPPIQKLFFKQCFLKDSHISSMSQVFERNIGCNLDTLELSNNYITSVGVLALTSCIQDSYLPRLQYLYLSNNKSCKNSIGKLFFALNQGACPAIREIDVDDLSLGEKDMKGICAFFEGPYCVNMERFNLSNNKSLSSCMSQFFRSLIRSKNSRLNVLLLNGLGINDNELAFLIVWLQANAQKLEYLFLNNNNITGKGFSDLLSVLQYDTTPYIKVLEVGNNNLKQMDVIQYRKEEITRYMNSSEKPFIYRTENVDENEQNEFHFVIKDPTSLLNAEDSSYSSFDDTSVSSSFSESSNGDYFNNSYLICNNIIDTNLDQAIVSNQGLSPPSPTIEQEEDLPKEPQNQEESVLDTSQVKNSSNQMVSDDCYTTSQTISTELIKKAEPSVPAENAHEAEPDHPMPLEIEANENPSVVEPKAYSVDLATEFNFQYMNKDATANQLKRYSLRNLSVHSSSPHCYFKPTMAEAISQQNEGEEACEKLKVISHPTVDADTFKRNSLRRENWGKQSEHSMSPHPHLVTEAINKDRIDGPINPMYHRSSEELDELSEYGSTSYDTRNHCSSEGSRRSTDLNTIFEYPLKKNQFQSLRLSETLLLDKDLSIICDYLQDHNNLIFLNSFYLSSRLLSSDGFSRLFTLFTQHYSSQLQILSIFSGQLSKLGKLLYDCFTSSFMSSLTQIQLCNCQLTSKDIHCIIDSLYVKNREKQLINQLEVLDLSCNPFFANEHFKKLIDIINAQSPSRLHFINLSYTGLTETSLIILYKYCELNTLPLDITWILEGINIDNSQKKKYASMFKKETDCKLYL